MDPVTFRVYGFPVPQARPRAAFKDGQIRVYDPANSRDWKRTVHSEASRVVAERSARFPMKGPLSVSLVFHMFRPKTHAKTLHHQTAPDVDNLAKAALDAMTGCLFLDDKQIVSLTVTKGYGEQPGVEVEIMELADRGAPARPEQEAMGL
jgi:Holliday junction resolvase RusA-like endonuclease